MFCLWLQVNRLEISIMCLDMLSETGFTLKSFMATLNWAIKSGWWVVYSLLRGHTIYKRGMNNQKPDHRKVLSVCFTKSIWPELFKLHHTYEPYICLTLPQLHTILMLSHKNNATKCQQESEPKLQSEPKLCHPVTRAKNATQYPGPSIAYHTYVVPQK